MNCKLDDLAFVVRSKYGNEMKVVRCVVFLPNYQGRGPIKPLDCWGVDGMLNMPSYTEEDIAWCRSSGFDYVLPDSVLRPIRDTDGQDEILRTAGLPKHDLLSEGYRLIEQLDEIAEIAKGLRK
jgi:hypothetical protein